MTKRKDIQIIGALLLLLTLVAGGCKGPNTALEEKTNYGPMAVMKSSGEIAAQAYGGKGVVMISEQCIFLKVQPDLKAPTATTTKFLLVWPTGRSKWDAKEKAVIYKNGADISVIRNGDLIEVGGAALVNDSRVEWMAPPDKSCIGPRWLTDSLIEF